MEFMNLVRIHWEKKKKKSDSTEKKITVNSDYKNGT